MAQHQIRLTFNSKVKNYEIEIAYIAQLIADKFGDQVDASLPLSKSPSAAKVVYFRDGIDFDEAFRLADGIKNFLNSTEAKSKLATSDISLSEVSVDHDYAERWRGKFAKLFTFEKK